jgi:Nuclease-related domain
MATLVLFAIIAVGIKLFVDWKLPSWIGKRGERFVSKKLNRLDPIHYKVLNDVMLPSRGNSATTQIDHIVVSNYGIFCIETKAYKGWIFGNAHDEKWTQVIFRHKERLYNPLRQNFAHTKAVEDLLGQRLKRPIVSLVAFPYAGKLKISGTDSVGFAGDVVRKIASYPSPVFTDVERDEIYDLLARANILDKEARKLHNREVRALRQWNA